MERKGRKIRCLLCVVYRTVIMQIIHRHVLVRSSKIQRGILLSPPPSPLPLFRRCIRPVPPSPAPTEGPPPTPNTSPGRFHLFPLPLGPPPHLLHPSPLQREGRKRDFETCPIIPPTRIGHDIWRGKLCYGMGDIE